jgi:hypothetical protein
LKANRHQQAPQLGQRSGLADGPLPVGEGLLRQVGPFFLIFHVPLALQILGSLDQEELAAPLPFWRFSNLGER